MAQPGAQAAFVRCGRALYVQSHREEHVKYRYVGSNLESMSTAEALADKATCSGPKRRVKPLSMPLKQQSTIVRQLCPATSVEPGQ